MKDLQNNVKIGVVIGSRSDFETIEPALEILKNLEISYEVRVLSAHRTPHLLEKYAKRAEEIGLTAIIAAAGGAAHLPGMLAAFTHIPVLGVPVQSKALNGQDSLFSIAQMPAGIPVATFAIGVSGAKNAALFAAAMILDEKIKNNLLAFRKEQTEQVLQDPFFENENPAIMDL